jgi:hypothetical protein
LLRRLRRGLASIHGQPSAESRCRCEQPPGRNHPAAGRKPPGHLRRTPAVLLHRRPKARPDHMPERVQLRRTMARHQPKRSARPLRQGTCGTPPTRAPVRRRDRSRHARGQVALGAAAGRSAVACSAARR